MKYRNALLAASLTLLLSPLALSGEEAGKKATDEKPKAAETADCQVVTGSRIRQDKPAKNAVTGKCESRARAMRTFTKEELETTGQMDLGDALRQLDPSFR